MNRNHPPSKHNSKASGSTRKLGNSNFNELSISYLEPRLVHETIREGIAIENFPVKKRGRTIKAGDYNRIALINGDTATPIESVADVE